MPCIVHMQEPTSALCYPAQKLPKKGRTIKNRRPTNGTSTVRVKTTVPIQRGIPTKQGTARLKSLIVANSSGSAHV
eukprot:2309517-Amphidinium_carterae.1